MANERANLTADPVDIATLKRGLEAVGWSMGGGGVFEEGGELNLSFHRARNLSDMDVCPDLLVAALDVDGGDEKVLTRIDVSRAKTDGRAEIKYAGPCDERFLGVAGTLIELAAATA